MTTDSGSYLPAARTVIEFGHAFTDPDPTYLDAFDVTMCRDSQCRIERINRHPIHHVQRTVTYSDWQPMAQDRSDER